MPIVTFCLAASILFAGCAGQGRAADTQAAPESPLQKYWSLLHGDEDQPELDRRNAELQEKIAECMGELGFDYLPNERAGAFVVIGDSDLDPESEEFAKTYGYGITTDPFGMESKPGEEPVDPNAGYVASLSESEAMAYNDALWGPSLNVVSTDEPIEYDWKTSGCSGKAQHDVFGEGGFGGNPEFEALSEEMNALYTEVRETPAVREKERAWSDCLADMGYGDFEHKDDASAAISEGYSSLFPTPDVGDPSSSAPPEPDPEALDALRQREIAQATADFACARDSGYAETLTSEQFRIEQAFIDEHKAELDALVARHGDASK
ncbi:hypothetical protein N1027_14685 [Herbiconiux sp. CPCC 205763]|uniref:Uncharacterized protein n=1 Tax=Herbiconiux aconitum TaxID=2970913 RepID=A0ABT2GT26_9MICO|nr:hypothetical protein [Herbiconiux aconitum]MCS5719382.1 hypothetical protein [Herbiconiux aconitum]